MLLKEMLRTMPGGMGSCCLDCVCVGWAPAVAGAGACCERLGCCPTLIEIGPVTFFIIKFKNNMYSKLATDPSSILSGHRYVSKIRLHETAMFFTINLTK